MTKTTLFQSNKSQAVRLPKDVAFPEGVRTVTVLRDGKRRIIAPADAAWDDFFNAPGVDLGERTGSEVIADHAPGARVIKAFNTLYAGFIEPDPRHEAGRQVVFYAGDDAEAKKTFEAVLDEFGFAPVDVGGLRDGGRLMQVDGGPLSALHVLRQD